MKLLLTLLEALISFLSDLFNKPKQPPSEGVKTSAEAKPERLKSRPKHAGRQLSKNFNSNEFDCKCDGLCDELILHDKLVRVLQDLRDQFGKPIIITSAYRCEEHNENVGGSSTSTHMLGIAVDLWCEDFDKLYELIVEYDPDFSIGRYDNFIHLDLRKEGRRWDYRTK